MSFRCFGTGDPLYEAYHDTEWGVPPAASDDERELFERVSLEAFQAGLSWLTILRKRDAFRGAFHGFAPDAVAAMADEELEALLSDQSIVRNRAKIQATRTNARATIALRADGGLDALIWSYRPDATPRPRTLAEVPTTSPESVALARDLRRRGFAFVGPTTAHALMEAIGVIDTHLVGSHRRGCSGLWLEG